MLIDTHAHLDYPDFDPDREELLQRARAAGVTRILSIGTHLDSSRNALALAGKYSEVFAVVGIHPTEADTAGDGWLEELRALATQPKVAAIGETGLDYHHLPSESMQSPFRDILSMEVAQDPAAIERQLADEAYKNQQADVFRAQLDLAVELKLNVVIHQRDAWSDTISILEEYTGRLRGVFHCFGGTPEQAAEVLAMGHLVSFTGILTFKNAGQVRATAQSLREDQFMVETDCPYLAPMPHRGKRCEPAHTRLIAEKLAEIRGVTPEEIARATTRTAEGFFRLGDS